MVMVSMFNLIEHGHDHQYHGHTRPSDLVFNVDPSDTTGVDIGLSQNWEPPKKCMAYYYRMVNIG